MSLGILAGLVIHITVIWLIDLVIIIVIIVIIIIINRPWPAGPGWIVGMIHF